MKMKKRIFAFALTVAMAVTAAGCGAKESTDIEALLKTANDTMAQVNSMTAQMDMQMDMSYEEESVRTLIQSNMDVVLEPFATKMTISTTLNDEVLQEYEMYAVQNADAVDAYIQTGGQWYHQPMASGDISQYNTKQNMELYLQNISSFVAAGTEEINGIQATRIEGVLTGDSMKEALKTSGVESVYADMGLSADDLVSLMDGIEDMPVKLWISADGYVVQYELDMTSMMQAIFDNLSGGEENPVTISTTLMRMTCSNFDAVQDIEVPAEALAAA